MANWVAANFQVIGGFFHFLVILRNASRFVTIFVFFVTGGRGISSEGIYGKTT